MRDVLVLAGAFELDVLELFELDELDDLLKLDELDDWLESGVLSELGVSSDSSGRLKLSSDLSSPPVPSASELEGA